MIEEAILIGLAAWRLAALLAYERGPFNVSLRLRQFLGFDHDENGEPVSWPSNFLAQVLSCVWCLGIYMVVLVWGIWELIDPKVVMVIAASSILVALEKWNHG